MTFYAIITTLELLKDVNKTSIFGIKINAFFQCTGIHGAYAFFGRENGQLTKFRLQLAS